MQYDCSIKDPNSVLHSFCQIAEYYNNTTSNDMGLSVIEGDTYLAYIPAKNLDLQIKPGDKVKKGILADIAMKEKRRLIHVYTKETSPFGVPYVATALPVIDCEGSAVGCIVTTQSTYTQESIMNTSEQLNVASQELLLKMNNLEKQAHELADLGKQLFDICTQTVNVVKNMDDVLVLINSITFQTNILGINATIEAARIGLAGKAFGVVADEIRNLAKRSSDSVTNVTESLEDIKQHNTEINHKSNTISQFVSAQVNTVSAAAGACHELSMLANQLQQIANHMWDE